jgi:hypothetical protein
MTLRGSVGILVYGWVWNKTLKNALFFVRVFNFWEIFKDMLKAIDKEK